MLYILYLDANTQHYKYTFRSLLIEFASPCLDISMLEYAKFPALIENSSSAMGLIISLEARFIENGIAEMDSDLLSKLWSLLGGCEIP